MKLFNQLSESIKGKMYPDTDDDYNKVTKTSNIYHIYDHYLHCTKHTEELKDYLQKYFAQNTINLRSYYLAFPKLRGMIIEAMIHTNNINIYQSLVEHILAGAAVGRSDINPTDFNNDFQKIRLHVIENNMAVDFIQNMSKSSIITSYMGHPFGEDDLYLRLPDDYKLGVVI